MLNVQLAKQLIAKPISLIKLTEMKKKKTCNFEIISEVKRKNDNSKDFMTHSYFWKKKMIDNFNLKKI